MTNFIAKNENRRSAHRAAVAAVGRQQAVEARSLRRKVGGAFGHEPKERFNALAVGTSGTPR